MGVLCKIQNEAMCSQGTHDSASGHEVCTFFYVREMNDTFVENKATEIKTYFVYYNYFFSNLRLVFGGKKE